MVKELVLSQKRQGLREALLAAATRAIAERGYQALRARDLANEVGCAVGAIYNVFPDLDALTLAVKSRTLDELQADILEQLGADETTTRAEGEARLTASARIYLDFAHRNRGLWLSACDHPGGGPPSWEAYMLRLDNIFANVERPLTVILPNTPPQRRQKLARGVVLAGLLSVLP